MEYLQYDEDEEDTLQADKVLNLIINGIPSILKTVVQVNKTWKKF